MSWLEQEQEPAKITEPVKNGTAPQHWQSRSAFLQGPGFFMAPAGSNKKVPRLSTNLNKLLITHALRSKILNLSSMICF